jgi:alpha-glucosidase (family GH31 glycosyl hydrolase)
VPDTVLLNQNQTSFTIGASTFTASSISNVAVVGNTLTGTLALNKRTTANVAFTFVSADNLQVTLTSNSGVPTSISERFGDATGQRYYGVWENALPTALDNRGVTSAYSGKEVVGVTTKDVFAASARAPFYFTNKNYGVYTNTQAQGTYTFGINGNTSFKFDAPTLQYNILHGKSPKEIIAQHNSVAGPAFMPPTWAFDTIFWRNDAHQLPSNSGIVNAQQLILDDAAKLAANRIHAGAMWVDRPYGTGTGDSNVAGWGNMDFDASFPNASQMTQSIEAAGMHLMLWAANKANLSLKAEAASLGYLLPSTSASPGINLSDPAAYAWFNSKIKQLNSAALLADGSSGISGYKIDRGGEGEIPEALINTQTTLLQKLLFDNQQEENPGDFFNFTRNINDQGRQYAAVWSGDPKTTWLGFQTSIKNGLRSGLLNFPMWGSDTGGYAGTPTQELFSRWIAFSAYSPMMEIIQGPGRNIFYDFSPDTLATTVKYTDLHHDLIPYTRSLLATALQNGTPIMRPMFLEFPKDSNVAVADMWDQYMYGPQILVAPITTAGAISRSVYLPSGTRWMDYNNRSTIYAGGQTITVSAPTSILPTFVREGAIIPRGDIVKTNNTWSTDWTASLRIEVFPSSAFASSFDYYNGSEMVTIAVTPFSDGFQIVTSGDLLLPGQFDLYLTEPTAVFLNGVELFPGEGYSYDPAADLLSVAFAGGSSLLLDIYGSESLFGTVTSASFGATSIPEPASLGILSFAAGVLVRRRRK